MMTTQAAIDLAERGLVPTPAIRLGIRSIVRRRLREQARLSRPIDDWIREMASSPVALATDAANAQHYEMPPAFFQLVLGPHLKYSGAYWPDRARTPEAWHANLVSRRAEVVRVLTAEFGPAEGLRAYHRWRIFFLACAELFAYHGGSEWLVSHYRLRRAAR